MKFDKTNTFCIHCREIGASKDTPHGTSKDVPVARSEFAKNHFREAGLDVTMFEGIHGRTFGILTEIECNIDGNNGWKISPGHVGLILSHYMVWSHIKHAGLEHAIVLEDDAHIGPNFRADLEQIAEDLKQLPGWDIVYLGWLDSHPRNKTSRGKLLCSIDGVPFGTHAMLISTSGAQKLLDTNRICWAHIDTQVYDRTLKRGAKWYVAKKSICNQRSQQSIEGIKWNPST